MTGRGGAEGYLFTAVRVIPAEGRVEARGKFVRRKEGKSAEGTGKEEEKMAGDAKGGEVEAGSPPKKIKLEQSMDAVAEERVETSNAAATLSFSAAKVSMLALVSAARSASVQDGCRAYTRASSEIDVSLVIS